MIIKLLKYSPYDSCHMNDPVVGDNALVTGSLKKPFTFCYGVALAHQCDVSLFTVPLLACMILQRSGTARVSENWVILPSMETPSGHGPNRTTNNNKEKKNE